MTNLCLEKKTQVTQHLFASNGRPFGFDLVSLNVQRGRDHGLAPYLTWRRACGLTPIDNWGQLLSIMDDDTVGRLKVTFVLTLNLPGRSSTHFHDHCSGR